MKILVVQIGRIGDMILTTPMFREIHRVYPSAEIHVLASHRNYQIIERHPYISKAWVYSKKILSFLRLIVALRHEKYDVWIDPKDHFSRESSMLATVANAPKRIGCNGSKGRVFNAPLPLYYPEQFHQTEINTASLELLGIHAESSLPELYVNHNSENYLKNSIDILIPYVVVNLSAGNQSRMLSFDKWKAICTGITHPVYLNYTQNDAELASKLAKEISNVYCFESRSILDAVSLINHAHLLISPDTAAIHIASAFNIPTIGLYPAIHWNYNKFRPLSVSSTVLMPDSENDLINDIPIDKIRKTIEQFVS